MQEVVEPGLHRGMIEVDAFDHIEPDLPQRAGDGMGVIGGIGQLVRVHISTVADHQRDARARGSRRRVVLGWRAAGVAAGDGPPETAAEATTAEVIATGPAAEGAWIVGPVLAT